MLKYWILYAILPIAIFLFLASIIIIAVWIVLENKKKLLQGFDSILIDGFASWIKKNQNAKRIFKINDKNLSSLELLEEMKKDTLIGKRAIQQIRQKSWAVWLPSPENGS